MKLDRSIGRRVRTTGHRTAGCWPFGRGNYLRAYFRRVVVGIEGKQGTRIEGEKGGSVVNPEAEAEVPEGTSGAAHLLSRAWEHAWKVPYSPVRTPSKFPHE